MDVVSYTEFRKGLASMLDKVNDDHAPLMVTRQNGKPAILMSLEDFCSYQETAYLTASPKNAARLNTAIEQLNAGKATEKGLLEE